MHPTLTAKGWDKVAQGEFPNTVLEAYTGLEKLVGRQRLAVPKDATDQEAYDALYNTLGRPGKPGDYKLDALDANYTKALDPAVKQHYLDAMHKAGIGQTQAEALFKANQEQWLGAAAAQEAAREAAAKTQKDSLALEWGMKADANTAIAKSTVRALDIPEETLSKLEDTLGYDGLFKLLHQIGAKFSEHGFVGTGQGGDFGGGPEAARAEITKLTTDTEFQAKLQHRDPRIRKDALDRWEELHKRLTPA